MAYSKLTTGVITEQTAAIVLKDIYNTKKEKVIDVNLIKRICRETLPCHSRRTKF